MVRLTLKPLKHITIYKDNQYNTFPSAVVTGKGQIMVGFRQAPDRMQSYGDFVHIDPSSKAVYVTSEDGEHWSPEGNIICDHYFYGVQDPCLNVLRDGTIFSTIFLWKVTEKDDVQGQAGYTHTIFDNWVGKAVGCYSIRSHDHGVTWDHPIPIMKGSAYIRGNCVELEDRSILAPLYCREDGQFNIVIMQTKDKGENWTRLATIPSAEGYHFQEPTLYRTDKGKLILFTRSLGKQGDPVSGHKPSPLFTIESTDEGRTWSLPVQRRYESPSPFHLLRLNSGHVLMTYGFRFEPYGIRAVLLDPECRNVDSAEEIVIRNDGLGFDIGYTSSVQLSDGRILITYYYYNAEDKKRYIAGTLCVVE